MLQNTREAFRNLEPVAAAEGFAARVREKISSPAESREFGWFRMLAGLAAIAALAIILVEWQGGSPDSRTSLPDESIARYLMTMDTLPPAAEPMAIPGLDVHPDQPGLTEDLVPCYHQWLMNRNSSTGLLPQGRPGS